MAQAILVLNSGSSSIKFSLFHIAQSQPNLSLHGAIDGIGDTPHQIIRDPEGKTLDDQRLQSGATHETALHVLLAWIDLHLGEDKLIAAGHRVVHGGMAHYRPALADEKLLAELDALIPLAPLHQPHNLAGIRAIAAERPNIKQIVCFDTGFHHSMPIIATRLALPRAYETEGVRRYGFHGLSYDYISRQLPLLAPEIASKRVIVAHLGNGASLCALQNGQSIDTTMSFTALDGLVMGTRSGNLDPGVVLYLQQKHGLSPEQMQDILYNQSGLQGVSGISHDMRELEKSTDTHAREAIDLFIYRMARETGALVSVLNGLDGLIFTGGIGEHAPSIRAKICEKLQWLGVVLNTEANERGNGKISADASTISVWVVPTDEEKMIAQHTLDVLL